MAADLILRTFGDASAKEDVLGLIENLTATENTFLNGLGKSVAINTVHSTLTDTLNRFLACINLFSLTWKLKC